MSIVHVNNFIDGEFVPSETYIDSVNPSTGEKIANIASCSVGQVECAISAARKAFKFWSSLSFKQRAAYVNKLADLVEQNIDELALLESKDQGKTLKQAREIEMPRVLLNLRCFANSPLYMDERATELDEAMAFNIQTRSPVGVAAIITPWNLPLYLLSFKLAPCIMYGNTCVCKPSEFTSLTAWRLCQLIKQAGFPNGVINVVFGDGKSVGEPLVRHKDVKLITFTGSTFTGGLIEKVTAGQFKKLSLELGGKNSAVIFQDADIQAAVGTCIRSSFTNQGELCLATSKIYVQSAIYQAFLERFVEETRKLKTGDPLQADTFVGALISENHFAKVDSYIRNCKGKIRCGLIVDEFDLPQRFKQGYFIPPTVLSDVDESEPIMQDEVFGPVTVITPFETTEEVIERMNSTKYGLCASIHTLNQSLALSVAKRLEVGTVWINCWLLRDLRMPFGGFKNSGNGREGQNESREFFTESKAICIKY